MSNLEEKQSGISKLSDSELDSVSGGFVFKALNKSSAGMDPEALYKQFDSAWRFHGFYEHGWTTHQKDAMCDQWESLGFPGTAESWLSQYKTW